MARRDLEIFVQHPNRGVVADDVVGPLHRIGRNRKPARQRFEDDKAKRVGARREDENIAGRIVPREFGAELGACKPNRRVAFA